MKIKKIGFLLIFILTTFLTFPSQVYAQAPDGSGKIIFGGTYDLKAGETLSGDLSIFGGTVTIDQNAAVHGDIFTIGGYLELNGTVTGDLVAVAGNVTLGDSAIVEGDLTTINAAVQRSAGSTIKGSTIIQTPDTFDFEKLSSALPPFRLRAGTLQSPLNLNFLKPLGNLLWGIFIAFALAALAMLGMLFLEKPAGRVAYTMASQPIIAGALGLLTFIVLPPLLLLLAITIILSPISLLGFLLLAFATLFGWITAGYEVGKRLSIFLKWECAAPACAGMGTFILSLVLIIVGWIPCIGWLATALVLMIGLGGVLMARFGIASKTSPEFPQSVSPQVTPQQTELSPEPPPATMTAPQTSKDPEVKAPTPKKPARKPRAAGGSAPTE
ncbi:MAG: polymer-forming cytoskeletal protein [Anaerolineaceae bacterium]|nr:polymer-forming cytoskeletal protein [Anaerolineaceae bacterium]